MSYHDDGEKDVGPIVASLSLGSDATMNFRVKPPKKKGKGKEPDDAKDATSRFENGSGNGLLTSLTALSVDVKLSTRSVLQLQLRHGDVTIMEVRCWP